MAIFTRPDDVSDIDPKAILAETYAMVAPFDVPVVVIRPEEFKHCIGEGRIPRISRDKIIHHFVLRLNELFDAHASGPIKHNEQDIMNVIVGKNSEHLVMEVARSMRVPGYVYAENLQYPDGYEYAHNLGENDLDELVCDMVMALNESVTGKQIVAEWITTTEDEIMDVPGADAEWQSFAAWHEYAHTTRAAEPQADKMAAVVTKQAFASNEVLQAIADSRMVRAVLRYDLKNQIVNGYGYGQVRALDEVTTMDMATIDNLSKEDIKQMRFEDIDGKLEAVQRVGRILEAAYPQAYENVRKAKAPLRMQDYINFKSEIETLSLSGTFNDDPDTQEVADRLVLAIDRISQGKIAYSPQP